MWKKIVPIAAVLLVAWVGLNLITGSDETEVVDTEATNEADINESDAEEVTATAEQSTDTTTDETDSLVAATSEEAEAAPEEGSDVVADVSASVETTSEDAAGNATASEESIVEGTVSAESPSETPVEQESVAETDTESTTETDTTTSLAATDSSGADTQAVVEMRYPTDPVTGLTIYDQGMVEVVIEPTVEPAPQAAEETVDTVAAADESTDDNAPVNEELAVSDDSEADSETGPEIVMEMRYPTDPLTGLTIYDDGKVEVPVEVADYWPTVEAPQETSSSDIAVSTEGRLPVDPVTGATVYPSEASTSTSDNGTTPEETANDGNRLPVDPVTGATIYADASSVGENDTETEQSADVESQRLPVDPVTGATIYPDAETTISTESSVTAEADSGRLPVDSVTGASVHNAVDAGSDTDSATAESTGTTTASLAVVEQRIDISGISRQIGGVFGATSAVLARSTDEATALAALPTLQTASASLVEVTDQFQSLPESTADVLGRVVKRNMATLKPLADTVLVKPGVGEVLSPVLQPMMDQLNAMAQ